MKRYFYVILVAVLVFIGAALLTHPVLAEVDSLFYPNDLALSEGLIHTIDFVEETAIATELTPPFVRPTDNAQPEQAAKLQNNYSFFDHSDPQRYPGFNDCDGWRNLIDDGWSATYRLETSAADQLQASLLIEMVANYWTSRGLDVHMMGPDQGNGGYARVWVTTAYALVQFNIDPRRGTAVLQGITHCLPPG